MFNYFILGIFVYIFCIPIVEQLAQTIVTYLKVLEILGASKIAKIQENLDAEEKEI